MLVLRQFAEVFCMLCSTIPETDYFLRLLARNDEAQNLNVEFSSFISNSKQSSGSKYFTNSESRSR